MDSNASTSPLEREIWDRLGQVMDPELDEPITDMGFVEKISISDQKIVTVSFRLPTYWCSPNFAFLMAQGIKREVEVLHWVARVLVRLEDHLSADDLNAGVNDQRSFSEVFAELSNGENLDEIRDKFDGKAFQRRQEVVLKALLDAGHSRASIVAMTLSEFQIINFDDEHDQRQKERYTDLLLTRALATSPEDLALVTFEAAPLTEQGFSDYQNLLRSVRINMEFSGALCRGLKSSRYKEVQTIDGEPTLVDFFLDRVPRSQPADAPPG